MVWVWKKPSVVFTPPRSTHLEPSQCRMVKLASFLSDGIVKLTVMEPVRVGVTVVSRPETKVNFLSRAPGNLSLVVPVRVALPVVGHGKST